MAAGLKMCDDLRPCFARKVGGQCMILTDTYNFYEDLCPFCKRDREKTDGKVYPYNQHYDDTYGGKRR